MPITFPTSRFGFLEQEVDIERQTLKGGTALSGEQDITSTDGGGRVFAEFAGGSLIDRDKVLAWRALMGILEEGVTRIVVPFCDVRHTPYLGSGKRRVPHSDKTPFSDGSLYVGSGVTGLVGIPMAPRATRVFLSAVLRRELIGGEWFSIEHPNKGWRAYKVKQVIDEGSFTFSPPIREAVDAATTLDFNEPRCLMVQDGRASTRLVNRRHTEAAIRFIEAP